MDRQTSAEMQAAIMRWIRSTVPFASANRLLPELEGCERFLRSHGVQAIPEPVRFGIIGVARIDNLLNQWFLEHRPDWLRHQDAETEHTIRDLTGVRLRKGTIPKRRSS